MSYKLLKSIYSSHEHRGIPHKGGFARLTLRLVPNLDMAAKQIILLGDIDYDYQNLFQVISRRELPEADVLKEYTPGYVEMAMKGIEKGAIEVLHQILGTEDHNISIVVEELKFDLVYSTQLSFYLAGRDLTQKLLEQAQKDGLLQRQESLVG